MQDEVFRNLPHLALADRDPAVRVNAVGDNTVEISGDGHSVTVVFDESTGLPARETYQQAGPGGLATIEEAFADWREVDGIKLPFKFSIQQNGKKFADVAVQEYKINTGLKAEELSQKP